MHALASRPTPALGAAIGVGLLLAAALIQWLLYPLVGPRIPFAFFLPAVGIAAMWVGSLPALIVLVGGVANAVFWLDPIDNTDRVAMGGYLVAGGILLAIGEYMRRVRTRAMDAEKVLARQVRDLRAIQEVGSRVLLMSDVPEQFSAVLQTLCQLLGTDKAQVFLFDPAAGCLRSTADVGLSESARQNKHTEPGGVGASGIAFKEQRTIIIEDTEKDERYVPWREISRAEGVRSIQSRPLVNMKGEVFGVLAVYFSQPRTPTERDTYLADVFSQMTSVLAERQMLAERSQALSRRVEVALETSAVPFAIFDPVHDRNGRIVDFRWEYLNKAAAAMLDRQPSELQGRSTRETMPRAWRDPAATKPFIRAYEARAIVEYDVRVPIETAARWFHVIASPLGNSLALWYADISERKHQEQMLRNADRRKDEFLATLAHELRNPLAPIRQATMIARSPSAGPQQKQWSLEIIDRQVSHMAALLDDLLDVARITRGKLELRPVVVDLRDVIEAALESTRPDVEASHQQLSIQWPEAPLWVKVDTMRISQVVSNLLTNACKYTPSGGNIWLSGRRDGDDALLEVRDNGIGIAKEDLERVFEMFTQVRHGQPGSSAGLGIGLALARGIAHMHSSSLTVDSPGPGQGSTFTLRIPLSQSAPKTRPGNAASSSEQRKRRILVADDNQDAADSLAEALKMVGHEVMVAYDGQAALRLFHETAPEIALLDIGMPGMNGNEVASAIHSSPEGASTLLVAITGWGQERDRAAARNAGFDVHFTKPVGLDALLKLIENPAQAARTRAAG